MQTSFSLVFQRLFSAVVDGPVRPDLDTRPAPASTDAPIYYWLSDHHLSNHRAFCWDVNPPPDSQRHLFSSVAHIDVTRSHDHLVAGAGCPSFCGTKSIADSVSWPLWMIRAGAVFIML